MSKWKEFTDSELKKLLWDAVEMQNSRYIKAIKEEMNRRNREQ